jgi:C4-dicarboxylate-specific signal transduction histidine kinase
VNVVTTLWSGVAGGALTMAGAHAVLWLMDRRGLANLAFSIVALSVAGISITELGMMHASSTADYGQWVRWFHLPNALAVIGLVVFVHLQFGTGRLWLAGLVVALRALVLVLNFVLQPNITWSEISSLRTIAFLGEPVSVVGSAVVRQPLQLLGTLASLLFIAYVADALARALRERDRETRRKALVICGGILSFIALAILESQLVAWRLVQMPIVVSPPFLIVLAAITYELSRAAMASRRMERETAQLRDELAHASRVKTIGQLSGALAHELKQPLTSILANAQTAQMLLKSGKLDVAELDAIVADICAADLQADAIIERARSFMKTSTSELRPTSLEGVVADVLALVHVDAVKLGITLEHSLPQALPQVRADRVQLSQVLVNLVRNAMDAVSTQRPNERKVRIEARLSGHGQVEVAVIDAGTGIPEDLLPSLFDAFVTTKQAGLGIGLALSRAIVQAHGGHLRAQNNPGSGATFRFTLPAA